MMDKPLQKLKAISEVRSSKDSSKLGKLIVFSFKSPEEEPTKVIIFGSFVDDIGIQDLVRVEACLLQHVVKLVPGLAHEGLHKAVLFLAVSLSDDEDTRSFRAARSIEEVFS
jgi:hypothetical protein